jgi:hypothetical protein
MPCKRPWVGPGLLLLLVLVGSRPSELSAAETELTDEQFLASLGSAPAKQPIDRRRLARLLQGIASTLDAGLSRVRSLHGRLVVPDAAGATVQPQLEARFGDYSASVAAFKRSATEFLDEPDSQLRWYQVEVDGQRACWQLDVHQRLIETYGARTSDLMTVAASRDACSRLRVGVFQPRVAAIVRDALIEQVYQREEIRKLEQQIAELEQLVDDLSEIEHSP